MGHFPAVKAVEERDKPAVAAFLRSSIWSFIHADYDEASALQWPGYLARNRAGRLIGVLGCGLDRPPVASVIYAALDSWEQPGPLFHRLLAEHEADLTRAGAQELVFIGCVPWLTRVLRRQGFITRTSIISYVRWGGPIPDAGCAQVHLRPALPEDAETAAGIDVQTFEPMWRYPPALHAAMIARLPYYRIAEWDGLPVGYAAGDIVLEQGQIIRLAVRPAWQGRGIGRRLLADALEFFAQQDVCPVTLNTQADNLRSRRLYEAFGFERVSVEVPALVKPLPPAV
ncbi:MAG: GNAT family N-acetyltransferase [Anaerolineae bacterium]